MVGLCAGQDAHAQWFGKKMDKKETVLTPEQIARQKKIDSARTARERIQDSANKAREHILDSTRTAQKRYYDSMRTARQKKLDSTRAAQTRYFDSMRVARERILDSTRKAQKAYNDSVQVARKHRLDSTRAAQTRYYDSIKIVREKRLDSIRTVRQRITDSLTAIREYRSSKHYKDSVAAVRQARLDSIKLVRQERLDSIKAERKRVTDSIVAVRTAYVDSLRAVQKKRADSLAVIREYRASKRYKDSVAVVRKLRLDSIKAVRTAYYDSIKTVRQKAIDSMTAVRKARTDSILAVRKAYTDSLKEVRQQRSDSLAKLKEKREKEKKVREKQKEEKAQLALELKIKKKREAWSNEKMLKKRWGFPRSVFQNTFTRFNYYFNADQKMDEALDNMQRFRQENYDSLLALYPFDPDRDSSVLASDMDSIIRKASLGIQIHDPRTKWGDDLYLLLGQAYYYKGDYENASDAFKYIVSLRDKKKKKRKNSYKRRSRSSGKNTQSIAQEESKGLARLVQHRPVHNDAILWLARTFTEMHEEGSAESVLDLLEADPNFPGSLDGRLALEKAYIRLSQKDYNGAVEHLTVVSKDNKLPNWVRRRAAYINGQLLQQEQLYDSSAKNFRLVQKLNPSLDMDFYAKKNMATSLMYAGGEQEETVAMLKKILKDGKFAKFYEQVYFLLGSLAVNGGNTEDAITYLSKGIKSPKATAGQKAKSYAKLGDIYYDAKRYEDAKAAYDSVANLIVDIDQGAGDDLNLALRRSLALESLTQPLKVIKDGDSLLTLAGMSEKEQKQVVRKYIKMLEDRRADSIFQAENAGLNAALRNNNGNNKNNFTNWYFSNPALMQKGYNAFKQKWGNRPLSDNWRRSSAVSFAQNDLTNGDASDVGADGIPTEESLLAMIPTRKSDRDSILNGIKLAHLDAAEAYAKDLEDYPPAVHMLDTLDVRFPQHEHQARAIYLRYLIALRQNNLTKAQEYSDILTTKYADTEWAKLVKPTEDGEGLQATEDVAVYYDATYDALMAGDYGTSLPRAQKGQLLYNEKAYKDRFLIIEAASQALQGSFVPADSLLTVFMTEHTDPMDSLRSWAEAVLSYITEERNKQTTSNLVPGTKVNDTTSVTTNASNKADSATTKMQTVKADVQQAPSGVKPAKYTYNSREEHYVLFSFKSLEQRTKGVEVAITDFNKFKFGTLGLQTGITMLKPVQGVLVIKTFDNKSQALIYMNSLKKTKQIFREYTEKEYNIVMISKSNYEQLMGEKSFARYLIFYQSKY